MKSPGKFAIILALLNLATGFSQIQPPAGQRSGPGVQAPQDEREPELLKTCKNPPTAGARRGGPARGAAPAPAQAAPREYKVTEISGVVAAGQQWIEIWPVDGNNADGIVATPDGGILIAQNDKSDVVKLDKNGKTSIAYTGTNTGGSLAMNSKGAIFIVNRGFKESIEQLAPQRKTLATQYNDDPLDCIGLSLNDLTADSKGGVYFTMGTVFYADSKGKITRYGTNLTTNGIVLSPDEKRLYVTNGPAVAVFDIGKDGFLGNQREFAKLEGGGNGDGSTLDSAGRLYVSSNPGVQVFASDGKYLGLIPTPRGIISLVFSGPDRKTLYAVARDNVQNKDWIIAIQMTAQGPRGRGK
jgi:gluconolactonase